MARRGRGSALAGWLIFVGIVAFLSAEVHADDFNVGGGNGTWTVPNPANSLSSDFYQQWASSNTFKTGDRLIFRYDRREHSVLRVTGEAYDACNVTSPIELYDEDDGALDVELEDATTYYFICGFTGHCPAGQKFSVAVQTGAGMALKYSMSMIVAGTTLGSFLLLLL